jgi:hypothetical protein
MCGFEGFQTHGRDYRCCQFPGDVVIVRKVVSFVRGQGLCAGLAYWSSVGFVVVASAASVLRVVILSSRCGSLWCCATGFCVTA